MPSGVEHIIAQLSGKKLLILGFGREGRSSWNFVRQHLPESEVCIADHNKLDINDFKGFNVHCIDGPRYLDAVHEAEVVIKTPGIPGRLLNQLPGQTITSQTDLFLGAFGNQTIGITGTKGKSTTSALTHHLLSATGFHSILTGNIGIPCFDIIPDIGQQTRIVFELSANQLELGHHSPHIAVLLNIFEEHLDHFGTYERYREAKLNLLKHTTADDYIIIHTSLQAYAEAAPARNYVFPTDQFGPNLPVGLPGLHNQTNAQAALLAAMAAGGRHTELMQHLSDFQGLPHRMEYVGQYGGVHFFNDSIATIPEATIAAIQTIGSVDFLLLGGYDRGIHYELLTTYLIQHPAKHLLLTGKAGMRLGSMLQSTETYQHRLHYFNEMEEAFRILNKLAMPGNTCLLSPAAASYDRYKNFEHRGDTFKQFARRFGS